MKILIAEDEPMVRKYLAAMAGLHGYQCVLAANGKEALDLFGKENPDIVLSDVQMPEMDGFALLKEIREQNSDVIVIILTGEGSGDVAARALQLGANNYLHKPVADKQLRHLLRQYATLIAERATTHEIERMVERRTLNIVVDNQLDHTTRVAQFLVNEVGRTLPEKERMDITLGLDELICNAIEHGNLGISQAEKEKAMQESDGLNKLYAQRLEDPRIAARRVRIEFTYGRNEGFEWIISDEGNGFDWQAVPSPLDEEGLDKPCGRGVFLGRMLFDHLEYRGKGNVVCLRKNPAPTPVHPTA